MNYKFVKLWNLDVNNSENFGLNVVNRSSISRKLGLHCSSVVGGTPESRSGECVPKFRSRLHVGSTGSLQFPTEILQLHQINEIGRASCRERV